MTEEGSELRDDEWDPPQINRHLPFPPPFLLLDLNVVFSFPLLLLWMYALLFYRGWHSALPSYFLTLPTVITIAWTLLLGVSYQRRPLALWLPVLWRYVGLAARSALLNSQHEQEASPDLGDRGWLWFVLSPEEGRRRLANVHMHPDGVLELSASEGDNRVKRFLKWLLAIAFAREPLVVLLKVSRGGPLDLLDPDARAGVWALRQTLVERPDHAMSLYLRVSPFPVEELLQASGRAGIERSPDLVEWASGLMQRRLLLAVPGATRKVLAQRLLELLGLPDQDGKLGQAGMAGARLSVEEVMQLRQESWGEQLSPSLGISPGEIEIDTGKIERLRTFTITGLPEVVGVGWMEPLTGRGIHCQLGFHIRPVRDSYAETLLTIKRLWWRGLSFGADKYKDSAWHARRTLDMIRRRQTSALEVALHVTVPASEAETTHLALREMVGKQNFLVRKLQPIEARMATEPTTRDPLGGRWWTDSQTVAAAWPGTGGVWVPGGLRLGDCPRAREPINWNPWWDETSLGCLFGRPGSGKTNLEQLIAAECICPHPEHWLAERRAPVIVAYLKPYDEWQPFCKAFNGQHYHLATDEHRGVPWRWALKSAALDAPVVAFNIVDLPDIEQVAFMSELEHWVEDHQKPHHFKYPLLYVIGECRAWAQDPAMAKHLQKYATQVRAMSIGLLCDTQRPKHLLGTIGEDLIECASMVCLMRLKTSERRVVGEMMELGDKALRELAQIDRPNTLEGAAQTLKGRGIIEVHGVTTLLQVRRFGFERELLDQTNPRLRDERWFDTDVEDAWRREVDADPEIDEELEEAWAARKNGQHTDEVKEAVVTA